MNIAPGHHFPGRFLNRLFASAIALSVLAIAPDIRAQADQTQTNTPAPKPKKKAPAKKKKPAPAETTPPPAAEETKPAAPEPAPAPAEEPKPAPADEAKKPAPEETPKTHAGEVDITDTREDPNTRYYFVGLRYRGTVIPKFIENIFVDEGGTFYSNMIGAELDMRKGGQSMIPWLVYADYGTGDTLFHQKGANNDASNYSVVHSNLKMIILGLDELWSQPIDEKHHWDFEFGFGVGIGIVFGDLINNWVFEDPNGPLVASTNTHYSPCRTMMDGTAPTTGCPQGTHSGATVAKVGGYVEPKWFNGGSVPNIFPNVWFPTLGIRYKPIKQMQARLGIGFSLTGFWFGLSADYGLEQPEDKTVKASRNWLRGRDML